MIGLLLPSTAGVAAYVGSVSGFTDFDIVYEQGRHLGRREALELMMAALERQAAESVDR